MRKMKHNLFGLLALLVAGAGVIIVLGAAGQITSTSAASGTRNQENSTMTASSPGSPAIRPTQVGTPAFTEADVRAYLATSPFPGGLTLAGARPAITEIVFVTSKQASDTMKGEYVGLPDTALVCYVGFQGPFSGENISHPKGAHPATFQLGEMVFDAQTGNLLVWGLR